MTKIDYKHQKKCRLCGCLDLTTVINLNNTPLANSFLKKSELKKKERYYPLKVNFCKKCAHLQLSHIVNAKSMFDNYLYLTNTSKQNRDHFEDYAKKVDKIMSGRDAVSILDIASNDGTFLKFFNKNKYKRVGIDPAKNLSKFSKKQGIKHLSKYFTFKNSKFIKNFFGRFDVITANHVCAHVSDLNDFFLGVKLLLNNRGIFIFEVSYLGSVIKKKTFDTIYHEHADYHSLGPLVKFVKKFRLDIFNFEIVKAQGGSIRVYACNKGVREINKEKIKKQIFVEKKVLKLFNKSTYIEFEKKINKVRISLNRILYNFKKNKFKIAAYGAAAKTTTLLNYFKINKNIIDFIVDDNSLKQNRFTPGTHIPIKSSYEIYKKKPNYIIILAWNYASHIMNLHKKYKKQKGKFIIPFPKIKIL